MLRVSTVSCVILLSTALGALGARHGASMYEAPQSGTDVLIQADEAFAAAAAADGVDGWMSFMAEDAARMPELGAEFVAGLDAIRRLDAPLLDSDELLLTWRPQHAYVLADDTYGITTGRYETIRRADDAVVGGGHYVSFWRRTSEGWRVVFDTGAPERRD